MRRRLPVGCMIGRSFCATANRARNGNSGDPRRALALFGIPHFPKENKMKPNHKVESVKWLSRYDSPNRRGGSFPRIDLNYQPRREEAANGGSAFRGGAPVRWPGLNRLANEVLRSDASRSFGIETAVLALIAVVSAWPIAMMISAIGHLLK